MITTRSFSISHSTWKRGTPTPNFECTPLTQSLPSDHRRRNSVASSVAMPTSCALSTGRKSCLEKLLHSIAVKPQRRRRPLSLPKNPPLPKRSLNQVKSQTSKNSTSRPTRSMHWATMPIISNGSAQQIALQPNRFVSLLSLPTPSHMRKG